MNLTPILIRALRYIKKHQLPDDYATAIHFGTMGAELWAGKVQLGIHAAQGLGMNASKLLSRLAKLKLVKWIPRIDENNPSISFYSLTESGKAVLQDPQIPEILKQDWVKRKKEAICCIARDGKLFENRWKRAIANLDAEAAELGINPEQEKNIQF